MITDELYFELTKYETLPIFIITDTKRHYCLGGLYGKEGEYEEFIKNKCKKIIRIEINDNEKTVNFIIDNNNENKIGMNRKKVIKELFGKPNYKILLEGNAGFLRKTFVHNKDPFNRNECVALFYSFVKCKFIWIEKLKKSYLAIVDFYSVYNSFDWICILWAFAIVIIHMIWVG